MDASLCKINWNIGKNRFSSDIYAIRHMKKKKIKNDNIMTHQNVELAEVLDCTADNPVDVLLFGDIPGDGEDLNSERNTCINNGKPFCEVYLILYERNLI